MDQLLERKGLGCLSKGEMIRLRREEMVSGREGYLAGNCRIASTICKVSSMLCCGWGWHWLFAPHTDASLEDFFGKNFGGFRIVAVFFSNLTISLSYRFLGRGMPGEASGVGDETHRNTYGLLLHRWELSRWI